MTKRAQKSRRGEGNIGHVVDAGELEGIPGAKAGAAHLVQIAVQRNRQADQRTNS
jgi:hypothetical protein